MSSCESAGTFRGFIESPSKGFFEGFGDGISSCVSADTFKNFGRASFKGFFEEFVGGTFGGSVEDFSKGSVKSISSFDC